MEPLNLLTIRVVHHDDAPSTYEVDTQAGLDPHRLATEMDHLAWHLMREAGRLRRPAQADS